MAKKKTSSKRPPPKGRPPVKGTVQPPGSSASDARKPKAAPRKRTSRPSRRSARHRNPNYAPLLIGGVLVVVALMVVVFLTDSTDDAARAGASEGAVNRLTSIPAATLETIGIPLAPRNVIALPAGTPEVVEDGKPVVLYYGAEFCPFCAVQRWPATVALSRFGTFTGLEPSTSAPPPEILPNTPTVTYHGSSYASNYITLSTVETQTRTFRALESPNDLQRNLFNTYNVESITGSNGGIPFMMIGNRYAWAGAQYDPSVLDDKSFDDIVADLADPTTDLAVEIGSAANYLTAMICQLTDGQPVEVCATPVIEQAQAALPGV